MNAEEKQLWTHLETNQDDFSCWERLVQNYDSRISSFGAKSRLKSEEGQIAHQGFILAIDGLLERFPLCFGYWIRLLEFIYTVDGLDATIETYQRAFKAFPYCLELWVHYCGFIVSTSEDDAHVLSIFELACDTVGLDFRAHSLWDKYLEYEFTRAATINDYSRVFALLERVLSIPLQQCSKYYEKYRQFSAIRLGTELTSKTNYEQTMKRVRVDTERDYKGKRVSEEQIIATTKHRLVTSVHEKYLSTESETRKRWVYEETIKKTFFDLRPLDPTQVSNWHSYLEFEEKQGDRKRICFLYERCLVPCAFYEEFWSKYTKYLIKADDAEEALPVYLKALEFVPRHQPRIRIELCNYYEKQKNPNEARLLFTELIKRNPKHLESVLAFANFERRQQNFDRVIEIYESALNSIDQGAGILVSSFALFCFSALNDYEKALDIFRNGFEKSKGSLYYFLRLVEFESMSKTKPAEQSQSSEESLSLLSFDLVKTSDLELNDALIVLKLLREVAEDFYSLELVDEIDYFMEQKMQEKPKAIPNAKKIKTEHQSHAAAWIAQSQQIQ